MEVWELLRPSWRRLVALGAAALIAAVAAVALEHAQPPTYQGRVSVYFAQALGLDTTSDSVDPTADQLTSVFELPQVERVAAASAGVPLRVVHDATLAHDLGSPVIAITAQGTHTQAASAAPALAKAGLQYYAEQGVTRAQSVQTTATTSLSSINAELAAFTAKAGTGDVDGAVAAAAAAAASAPPGTPAAQEAAANLARLQALQPEFDLLTTEVQGARTAVSNAYAAVGAAQGVLSAVGLPGNVVDAPVTPASRVTAYLRAAVGAAVVVLVLGLAYFAVRELRRRRAAGEPGAPGLGPSAAGAGPAGGRPVVAGDFPLLASDAYGSGPSVNGRPGADVVPADPYLLQAQRVMLEQRRQQEAAQRAWEQELQRRAVRDALQRAERAVAQEEDQRHQRTDGDWTPPRGTGRHERNGFAAPPPRFAHRARAQIRVLEAAPTDEERPGPGTPAAGS